MKLKRGRERSATPFYVSWLNWAFWGSSDPWPIGGRGWRTFGQEGRLSFERKEEGRGKEPREKQVAEKYKTGVEIEEIKK